MPKKNEIISTKNAMEETTGGKAENKTDKQPVKNQTKKEESNTNKALLGFSPSKKDEYFFVSYSRADAERVAPFALHLRAHGVPLWYDEGIEWGENWWRVIKEKIHSQNPQKKCLGVFLFLSEATFKKENSYVFHEFYWAINQEDTALNEKYSTGTDDWKMKIFPVFLDDLNSYTIGVPEENTKIPEYVQKREGQWQQIYKTWLDDVLKIQYQDAYNYTYDVANGRGAYEAVCGLLDKFPVAIKPKKVQQTSGKVNLSAEMVFEGSYIKKRKKDSEATYSVTGKGDVVITGQPGGKIVATYTGDVTGGELTGKGKITWPDGNEYVGEFFKGKRHGRGKTTYRNQDVYEGFYFEDKKHGKGRYQYANGDCYEGDFKEGSFNGHGVFTWKNKDKFDGNWENGIRKGKGTLTKGKVKKTANWSGDDGEII